MIENWTTFKDYTALMSHILLTRPLQGPLHWAINYEFCILLETAFLNENRKKKTLQGKKRFPQFLLFMYVLFVCLCVCLSVVALQPWK